MIPRGNQGPIQRAFTGLLGLLDLKGSEVAPNSMRGDVQPIIDIRQYLLAGRLRSFEGTGSTAFSTAQFVGCTVPVRVPEGKVWIVQAATSYLNIALANNNQNQWVACRRSGAVFSQAYSLGAAASVSDGFTTAQLGCAGFVGCLVLPGGWEFGIGLGGVAGAGPYSFNVGVLASEFDA